MEKTVVSLVILLCLGIFVGGNEEVSLNENSEDLIVLDVGQKIEIKLEENPSTGCLWHYEISKDNIVELLSHRYENEDDNNEKIKKIGGGGIHYWVFKARKPGEVKITFKLYQDWNSEKIYKTRSYNIKVISR